MGHQFHTPAPNTLRVANLNYVATWAGFVCVAFAIDAFPENSSVRISHEAIAQALFVPGRANSAGR